MNTKIVKHLILICIIAFQGCTTKKEFVRIISQDITSQSENHYKDINNNHLCPSNFFLNPDSLLKLRPNFNNDTVSVIINKIDDGGREYYIICNRTDTIVYCVGKIKPLITTWDQINCHPKKKFFSSKRKEMIEKFDTISLNRSIEAYKKRIEEDDDEICGGLHSYVIRIIFYQKKYRLSYMYIPNYITE